MLKCSDQSFCLTKQFCSQLKSPFLLQESHFQGLMNIKNGLFSLGQNFFPGQKYFVLDNLGFVLDKKYFVRAEGQGICHSAACSGKSILYKWLFLVSMES